MTADTSGTAPTASLAPFGDGTVGTQPQTARGRRTRDALVAAARVVFERDGYMESRLVDIVAEAKCSIGSFYTWFDGKDEIFAAVLQEAVEDMLQPAVERPQGDPVAGIRASHRAYLEAYARNARLNRMLDQAALIDPRFLDIRRARSAAFTERNARAIRQWQEAGLADPSLDPHLTAMSLSGMLSRLAIDIHLHGLQVDTEALLDVATTVWVRTLRLPESPSE